MVEYLLDLKPADKTSDEWRDNPKDDPSTFSADIEVELEERAIFGQPTTATVIVNENTEDRARVLIKGTPFTSSIQRYVNDRTPEVDYGDHLERFIRELDEADIRMLFNSDELKASSDICIKYLGDGFWRVFELSSGENKSVFSAVWDSPNVGAPVQWPGTQDFLDWVGADVSKRKEYLISPYAFQPAGNAFKRNFYVTELQERYVTQLLGKWTPEQRIPVGLLSLNKITEDAPVIAGKNRELQDQETEWRKNN